MEETAAVRASVDLEISTTGTVTTGLGSVSLICVNLPGIPHGLIYFQMFAFMEELASVVAAIPLEVHALVTMLARLGSKCATRESAATITTDAGVITVDDIRRAQATATAA